MRTFSLIMIYLLLMIFLISVHSYASELKFEINRIDKSTYTGRIINNTEKHYDSILVKVKYYYYNDVQKITKEEIIEFHNVYPNNSFPTKIKKCFRNKWRWYEYTIFSVKHMKERKY
jgi:hypothetical protein